MECGNCSGKYYNNHSPKKIKCYVKLKGEIMPTCSSCSMVLKTLDERLGAKSSALELQRRKHVHLYNSLADERFSGNIIGCNRVNCPLYLPVWRNCSNNF